MPARKDLKRNKRRQAYLRLRPVEIEIGDKGMIVLFY